MGRRKNGLGKIKWGKYKRNKERSRQRERDVEELKNKK